MASSSDWGDFPCTHLHFGEPESFTIDVRGTVTRQARASLAARGLGGAFAVVTAQDPRGRTQPPEVNARLAAKLRAHVATLGVTFAPVEACSPDRSHCEHSLALAMRRHEAVDLAREYDQLAIFWFDGDAFWIVPAKSSKRPARLAPET